MDVLYIVGRGSRHNNDELRWSLRALERFGKNLSNVIIAGYVPDWVSSNAVKVSIEDADTRKQMNIANAIFSVIDNGLVDGEFLYSSDDHFLVRNVDLDNYPYWYKRRLPDQATIDTMVERLGAYPMSYNWLESLVETRNCLLRNGYKATDYSCHCNTHFHTDDYEEVRRMYEQIPSPVFGYEPTCMFMNVRMAREKLPTEFRRDVKVFGADSLGSMEESIGSLDTFSIDDSAFESTKIDFRETMYGLYSWKSSFER